MKTLTMITRHGVSKEDIKAFTLITADYQTVTMSKDDLIKSIKNKTVAVSNMEVGAKGLVSTNGALDKYTFINMNTNQVEGTPRAVILDRVEQDGRLVGYTVFTQNGQIREFNVAEAAMLAGKGLVSNGKVRHTSAGDTVSAIGGTYPLRTIEIAKAPKGELTVEILYFSASTKEKSIVKYAGAIISGTSAVVMSKINSKLTDSNAKVKAAVAKLTCNKDTSALAIQRMGATSIYGVFELADLKEIAEKASKTTFKEKKAFIVSNIDYTTGEAQESIVKIDKAGAIKIVQSGTCKGDKGVEAYAKNLHEVFGDKLQ